MSNNNDGWAEWEDFFRMLFDEPKPQEEKTEPIEAVLNLHSNEPKKLFNGFFEQMEELEKVTDPSKFQELIDYIKELYERYGIEED